MQIHKASVYFKNRPNSISLQCFSIYQHNPRAFLKRGDFLHVQSDCFWSGGRTLLDIASSLSRSYNVIILDLCLKFSGICPEIVTPIFNLDTASTILDTKCGDISVICLLGDSRVELPANFITRLAEFPIITNFRCRQTPTHTLVVETSISSATLTLRIPKTATVVVISFSFCCVSLVDFLIIFICFRCVIQNDRAELADDS